MIAVVTGASAGIGREFCEQLAGRGYGLVLVARDAERLQALAHSLHERHGVEATVHRADLSREEDIEGLAARLAELSGLSMLVNNAGFGAVGVLAEADPVRQVAMIRLHVLAPMRLSQAALPVLLRNRQGAIINVSSVAGFTFSAGNVNYCATKAYLTNFSLGLAAELARSGVLVQALCPGFTRSEFHQRAAIEPNYVRRRMWLTAENVVRSSLRAIDRGGPVVCVPGLGYKVAVGLLRMSPPWLIARLTDRRRRV